MRCQRLPPASGAWGTAGGSRRAGRGGRDVLGARGRAAPDEERVRLAFTGSAVFAEELASLLLAALGLPVPG